ncbi:WXG100 family type VII secretion target [Paenibacillus sp. MDMC362]|uniref:WXG100 family type VII secretion target n=1 Tax=Paenibacillus sp. MDMC362 TaxID=2977365 RepID=UPI000DC400DA|nr:WXG100 family type VII secretion target [Paenibacillus sp. MDMC362]RAR45504.1 WXG100 family type VII secretion target [Paenibacillus sp. MDMC362]
MPGRIEVSLEELRRAAADIRSGSDYGGELVARLSQVIETLNAEWEGVSQQRFRTEAEETKAQLMNFIQMMNSMEQELMSIAARFAEADGQ